MILDFEEFNPVLLQIKNFFDKKNFTLSAAESCTGGLLSGVITAIPGSSSFFLGGTVVYSNEQKINILGINPLILEKFGAVSEQCSNEMALKIRNLTGSDISVSTTGIAGPQGGTLTKPVGTVYSSFACAECVKFFKYDFTGSRNQIRLKTVENVLKELLRFCNNIR